MGFQALFVVLFAVNLLLIWVSLLSGRAPWYRFPGALVFLVIPVLTVLFDQPHFELDYFWWRIAGGAAILAGAAIVLLAVVELRKLNLKVLDLPGVMVATGPYQYVRHPVYLGLIFVFVGWWWVWAAVYSFYFGMFILAMIWIQGYLEEKLILEKQFGDKYRECRQNTGMFWIK